MKQAIQICLVLFITFFASGCLLAPVVQEIKSYGLGEGDRQEQLNKDVKAFIDALHWKRAGVALAYADDSYREGLKARIRSSGKSERVVESRVDFVDFVEGSEQADVEVLTKYYRIPYYVVEERREIQDWRFSLSSGWKIFGTKEIKDNA